MVVVEVEEVSVEVKIGKEEEDEEEEEEEEEEEIEEEEVEDDDGGKDETDCVDDKYFNDFCFT